MMFIGNSNVRRTFLESFKNCLFFPEKWFCICRSNLAFSSFRKIRFRLLANSKTNFKVIPKWGKKYRKGFVNAFVFIKQMRVVPFHYAGVTVSVSHTTEVLLLVFHIPRKCYCQCFTYHGSVTVSASHITEVLLLVFHIPRKYYCQCFTYHGGDSQFNGTKKLPITPSRYVPGVLCLIDFEISL